MSYQSKSSSKSYRPKPHSNEPLALSAPQSQPQEDPSLRSVAESSAPAVRRLGSYLLEAGLINTAQIEVVLNDQQMMQEMRFGEVLVARGWIKAETIDFVMRRVVEPDRAHQAASVIPETQRPPEVSPPPRPTSPPQSPPSSPSPQSSQSRVMARARSLDGEFEFDIVDDGLGDLPPTTPFIRSTDSGQGRNDRKSLPSTPDEDGVNWAG